MSLKEKAQKFKDSQLFNTIKDVAPGVLDTVTDIAATVYPPLGAVNMVVDSALNMLDKDKDKEAIAKIKEAKSEYQEDYLEYYRLDVEDRKSARVREATLAKLGAVDWMMYLSGIVGLSCFALVVWAIIFYKVPENALLHQLVGMVEGVAISIFAYYFGSSKGSKDKDKK